MQRLCVLGGSVGLLLSAQTSFGWTVINQIRDVQASALDTFAQNDAQSAPDLSDFSCVVQVQSFAGVGATPTGVGPGSPTGFAIASQNSILHENLLQSYGALEGGTFGAISTNAGSHFETTFVVEHMHAATLTLNLDFPGALASFAAFSLSLDQTTPSSYKQLVHLVAEQGDGVDLTLDPEFLPPSIELILSPGEYHLSTRVFQQGDESLSFAYDVKLAGQVVPLPPAALMAVSTLIGAGLLMRTRRIA